MHTSLCHIFGIDTPIFAFSHCRDVVVEVSKAGGLGVLGGITFTKEQLAIELEWIDAHIGGRPYGVDLFMAPYHEHDLEGADVESHSSLPHEHLAFVDDLLRKHNVPALAADDGEKIRRTMLNRIPSTEAQCEALLEIVFAHPVRLIANASQVSPSARLIERAHSLGIKLCTLVGSVDHAASLKGSGMDFVVAHGTEAGGQTGAIATMVLIPQVVDLLAPMPVVAAGGIANGRQIAAALALGAEGVWCGTVWLGTTEAETAPEIKRRIFEAGSADAVYTRSVIGKPMRALRSGWTEAWTAASAPEPLSPLQHRALTAEPLARINRARIAELMTYPVGQVIGQMTGETTVRQVVYDMLSEYSEAVERLSRITTA